MVAAACLALGGCAARPAPYGWTAPPPGYYGYLYGGPEYPLYTREGYGGYEEHEEERQEFAGPQAERGESLAQEQREERNERE